MDRRPGGTPGAGPGSSPATQTAPGSSERTEPGAAESSQATPGGKSAVKPGEQGPQGLWDRANLFDDLGGLRTRPSGCGITFGLTESADVLGNPSGGVRRGVIYKGLIQFGIGIDTEKAFGLVGDSFNATGYQIHGRGLSQNALGNNLNTVSSLEAPRGTLLFELRYEQVMLDKKLAVRVGQLAADQEFMISQYAGLFTNHTLAGAPSPAPACQAAGRPTRWPPRACA